MKNKLKLLHCKLRSYSDFVQVVENAYIFTNGIAIARLVTNVELPEGTYRIKDVILWETNKRLPALLPVTVDAKMPDTRRFFQSEYLANATDVVINPEYLTIAQKLLLKGSVTITLTEDLTIFKDKIGSVLIVSTMIKE